MSIGGDGGDLLEDTIWDDPEVIPLEPEEAKAELVMRELADLVEAWEHNLRLSSVKTVGRAKEILGQTTQKGE